jgi:hypothetical protein
MSELNTLIQKALRNPEFQTKTDKISDADRKWFLAHPTRKCRLRPIHLGDVPAFAVGSANHVIVYQISPGVRLRCPVETFDLVPDNDAILYAAVKRIMKHQRPDVWRHVQKMRRKAGRAR